ncbi:MAG: calcium-binding protein [Actinomycetota bacterium]
MKRLVVLGSLALLGLPVQADAAATCAGKPVTITGSAGVVNGTAGDDVIDATASQISVIDAGAGDDIICLGDNLVDAVIGGAGTDTISYEYTTTIMVAELDGRDGITDAGVVARVPRSLTRIPDPLPGGIPPASEIKGGVDVLLQIEVFIGSPQDDIIIGRLLEEDLIFGGAGDDIILGLFGNDELHGGPGNDILFGDGVDEVVYDPIREQQIGPFTKPSFATDDDVLYGEAGNDGLNDETGKNIFYGGAGDDGISGGWNDDLIDGGTGVDVASFAGRPLTLDLNITTRQNTGHGMDTVINIEDVLGSEFGDTIIGTFGPNIIRGQGGNDTLYGRPFPSTSTVWDTIDGGAGSDTCFGVRNYNCETIL